MSTQGLSWQALAFNQATESENQIHSDEVARRFGFRGGLVPGVTVHAYLAHPALERWGRDWLERGSARVVLRKPLYEGAVFRVALSESSEARYEASLTSDDGVVCAEAVVALPREAPARPLKRGDAPATLRALRPSASRVVLEKLREEGMGALRVAWQPPCELDRYLADPAGMAVCVRSDGEGLANPAFTLGIANWVLAANVRLGPWIHVESRVQHFAAIEAGENLVAEARVVDLFARGRHEFVDLDVAIFTKDGEAVLQADHRAIYLLGERL